MTNWAENECRIACKKENPSYDFDGAEFDYGCSCYKSALKAYRSLLEDDHSWESFGFTKNILMRLMDGQPLTPIRDEDFFNSDDDIPHSSDEYLKKFGLKSEISCPRMSSLFRTETMDGKVSYHDVDREICIDIENPSDTFHSEYGRIVDELFPISMPYVPKRGKYEVYCQTFLADRRNGDLDTRGIIFIKTPTGERIDVNRYWTQRDGKMVSITKDEYDALYEKRIIRLPEQIAEHMLQTLVSNTGSDEEIDKKEHIWKKVSETDKDKVLADLVELCNFFDTPDHWRYNTFDVCLNLCRGEKEALPDSDELARICDYLQDVKNKYFNL